MTVSIFRQSREIAPEIQEVLTRAGGLNPYRQPRFRAIWGWNRLTLIGGEWINYDGSGNRIGSSIEVREVPKYEPYDRWYIEKWCAPELYGSKEHWEATTTETIDGIRIAALGPYPERGDYELSWRCEVPICPVHNGRSQCIAACIKLVKMERLELTASIAQEYVNRVLYSEQFSLAQRLWALREREKYEQKKADERRHDAFSEKDLLFTNPDSGKKSYIVKPV